MNLKLILIFALCFLIIYVAFKIFSYYKQRQQFYENLTDFCSYLELQITFLKEDIQKIVNSRQKFYSRDFENVLQIFQKTLNKNENFDIEFSKKLSSIKILKEDEKQNLVDFFGILGKTNLTNQLVQIQNFKSKFLTEKNNSKNENKNFGILSIKLGLLLACGLFIIFI